MRNDRHLFTLAPGLFESASQEEVEATAIGLKEVGLFEMPYPRNVYLQISAKEVVGPHARNGDTIIYGPFGPGQVPVIQVCDAKERSIGENPAMEPNDAADLATLLIVLLATRNARKSRVEHKLAKLGIGKRARTGFASTTTISFPAEFPPDVDNPPKGGHKAPHLRRGHVRRQPYGKERAMEKTIWIAPIFVNADPEFVASRKRYRIK